MLRNSVSCSQLLNKSSLMRNITKSSEVPSKVKKRKSPTKVRKSSDHVQFFQFNNSPIKDSKNKGEYVVVGSDNVSNPKVDKSSRGKVSRGKVRLGRNDEVIPMATLKDKILVVDDEHFCISAMDAMMKHLKIDTDLKVDFCNNG